MTQGAAQQAATTAATGYAKRALWKLIAPVAAPLLAGFSLLVLPLAVIAGAAGVEAAAAAASSSMTCSAGGTAATVAGVDVNATQMGRAQTVANVAAALGLDSYAATVALATAQQESTILMLANDGSSPQLTAEQSIITSSSMDYPHDGVGRDYDSVNTFQQRWIAGWGAVAQLMDPVYAAEQFYDRLVDVPNWQTIPLTDAAQAVQISGYPDAYAQWEPFATELTAMLWPGAQAAAANPGGPVGGVCPGLPVPPGSWIRPTDGAITSTFGPRWGSMHEGVDIAGPRDTPIYAAADGTVTRAECSSPDCSRDGGLDMPGYGNLVEVDHGAGESTRYGHMSSYTVTAGQAVTAGALIGYQGSTGNSTGVHCHFETHVNGASVDPVPFMAARGVDLYVETAG